MLSGNDRGGPTILILTLIPGPLPQPNTTIMHESTRTLSCLLMTVVVLACSGWTWPASPQDPGKTVFLVRHAEKCTEPADDPGLTAEGTERAVELARVLKDIPVDAIYSTPFERTLATVRPLVTDKSLTVMETPVESGFLEALVQSILASDADHIVVSGHSNTTPRVVNLLAGTSYEDLAETEYDRLYVVHLPEVGVPTVNVLRYGATSGDASSC